MVVGGLSTLFWSELALMSVDIYASSYSFEVLRGDI